MSPRQRRLVADLHHMQELAARDARISFQADGDQPETYEVMLACDGLAHGADGRLCVRSVHRFSAYLHLDYPRRPPQISWLTPIFHPNILAPDRNGGLCLGLWSASESLADLVTRVAAMVEYKAFNPNDALDPYAAAWVLERGVQPGMRLADLVSRPPAVTGDDDLVVLTGRAGPAS
jgi:ubiquitin-protein ligase